MARVVKFSLATLAVLRAGALDSAAEAEAEEFSAGALAAEVQESSGHRAYLDVTVGAVSAGAQAAEVQELSGHGHRAYMDVTVGAVSAGAQAAEVQELSGHGHRAYMDVTVGAVSAGAQAAEVQELTGHRQRAYLDVVAGAVSAVPFQRTPRWMSSMPEIAPRVHAGGPVSARSLHRPRRTSPRRVALSLVATSGSRMRTASCSR
ncbi:unnamed protein product [Prorocentrum cordatum]|uniref:Uncharacterized protein n=1 Tax=Prorocentrum cordatum TaxID=2364126 RepID=A0ABN9URU5_9DINO|nr:unnamed protein product [Polarella glacialis]